MTNDEMTWAAAVWPLLMFVLLSAIVRLMINLFPHDDNDHDELF
jgi:hypothetical protein